MAVYSWGANSHGQLGLGYANELCPSPRRLTKISFNPTNVRCIKAGGGHVFILDNIGQLHACGWNNRGQLGVNSLDDKNEFICIPKDYFDNASVAHVACGWDISGAITTDKALYLWGSNGFQQLGICQRGFGSITQPMRLNLPWNEIPMQISFGLRHCCIRTDNHKVYVLGKFKITKQHEEGLKITEILHNKVKMLRIQMENGDPIDAVVSGQKHILLVVNNWTKVIGIGDNKFGQSNSYQFNDDGDHIKQIAAGWTHNGVLTDSGKIFLWGRNSYGQLGTRAKEFIPTPIRLHFDGDVPCKLHLGSEHGLVVSKDRYCFTWGWNEHGNCGNGSTENLYYATLVDLPTPCKIAGTAAGAAFCYAICEE